MRETWNAAAVVALLLIAVVFGSWATGFWPAITSSLFAQEGPAGLTKEFGVNLVSEAIGILSQVVITFAVVQFVVGRRDRLNKLLARRRLADAVAELFQSVASKIANTPGILPGLTSDRRDKKHLRFSNAIFRYDRAVDEAEEDQLHKVDDLFDGIVFGHDATLFSEFKKEAEIAFKMLCKDPLRHRLMRLVRLRHRDPHWKELLVKVAGAVEDFINKRKPVPRALVADQAVQIAL